MKSVYQRNQLETTRFAPMCLELLNKQKRSLCPQWVDHWSLFFLSWFQSIEFSYTVTITAIHSGSLPWTPRPEYITFRKLVLPERTHPPPAVQTGVQLRSLNSLGLKFLN